ncbi:signal recognition particle protein [Geminicoccus flavidas]|uniref:signal recognition particle protein n=1 Tax=Geminicoccus flavidas TaxID=2506407 RepID=UPI00135A5DB4|nr:signal recognition particle protein [Geminicoccus flavidas]
MFENLTTRLGGVFDRLRRRGALSEADVAEALREIRVALLEADVALPVVKEFVAGIKERAIGQEVIRSITPGQQIVKIVNDRLIELLGGTEHVGLDLGSPPSVILMCGLQGSGKTTTSGKLALRLKNRERKKVLLASLDVQRPAAQKQLQVLAEQTGTGHLPIVPGQKPVEITQRALDTAHREGYDVVILDTAGRLQIDDQLMDELAEVKLLAEPQETLLVADGLTGQTAVDVARAFNDEIGVDGIVLTRMDGDARGGAALSMRQITGKPIKFVGVGEKLDQLEPFVAERVAGRILDMGDVVSLVEKAVENIDREEAEKLAKKVQKGRFDLADYRAQLVQMKKMGGMQGMLSALPGVQKIKKQLDEKKVDERVFIRQAAIIDSMTPLERREPDKLNASRKRRIAKGSGTTVQDVNQLLKQHRQMQDMMKQMKKMGGLQNLIGKLPKGMIPPGMLPRM